MNSASVFDGSPCEVHSFVLLAHRRLRRDGIVSKHLQVGGTGEGRAIEGSQFQLAYRRRTQESSWESAGSHGGSSKTLILGDISEASADSESHLGNGVIVRYDAKGQTVRIKTSLIGLPSVFIYEDPECVVITSDLHLLRQVQGLDLRFDLAAVRELGYVGHPIGFRTLFRGVSLIPGGTTLQIGATGQVSKETSWKFPEGEQTLSWSAYIDEQIAAMRETLRAMDLSASVLSLTAGLDTRAIMALLVETGRLLPACTISGTRMSLDARIARRLAKSYGMKFEIVSCAEDYCRQLPELVTEASRLSGGLASLGQAPQVFFYRSLGNGYRGRVSGYLGNQIGRGGTEKLSNRNADSAILTAEVRRASDALAEGHWFQARGEQGAAPDYQFLLQREVPFSSVGNYCVGNHFVVEQSPYASRAMIELLPRRPLPENGADVQSMWDRRVNDLRHRFFGEPLRRSFQRSLIAHQGGFVASCPINWGWRAEGGVSISGLFAGGLTFVDAVAGSRGIDGGLFAKPPGPAGLLGLHDYRQPRAWIDLYLKDFLFDLFSSERVKTGGLLDLTAISAAWKEHFSSSKKHYGALVYALDLALAQETFLATV